MKLVVAVIGPGQLEGTMRALRTIGIGGMTVCAAFGPGRAPTEIYRGRVQRSALVPLVRIEVLADDLDAPDIVHVIAATATGRDADAMIWVSPVDDVVWVRTGEHGAAAV